MEESLNRKRRNQFLALVTLTLIFLWLAGCASLGAMQAKSQGEKYLSAGDYRTGIDVFSARVRENPDDAAAQYYLGRCFLAEKRSEEASRHLQKAAELDPKQADYHFWLGVSYWSLLDFDNERRCYQRTVALDPGHVPAHVYLGHNYLDKGEAAEALKEYETALEFDAQHPEALFNRALVLGRLGRSREEAAAWKDYLKCYPDGSLARQAADHLNSLGDFTYRNHLIGIRLVTLDWIRFQPGASSLDRTAEPSLRVVGSILSINKTINLEIASYCKGDAQLAKARGMRVRQFLAEEFPEVDPARLKVSSFGQPEKIATGGKIYALNHSIAFRNLKK